ncbi:MAG: helicase, partial [Clostridia bacterium]|nr:helicase [Clostridia bacterium]
LADGEKGVLNTAIKILIWKIHCKTFKDICFYRYAYASRLKERRDLKEKIKSSVGVNKLRYQVQLNNLYAAFVSECNELPNKKLNLYSMFGNREIKANEVDYDRIVFDTYDYLDKTIGFHLSDIFYAAFQKYYESTQDSRAEKLAKYVKYGTDSDRHIWMLRYGLTFEDIEWAENYIKDINQEEIVFNNGIEELEPERYNIIKRFVPNI